VSALRSVHIGLQPHRYVAVIPYRYFHYINANMSDIDLDKEIVYVTHRDVFKGKLAQLRKQGKVCNIVEKYKNHLYY
jgi:hypothetical protein